MFLFGLVQGAESSYLYMTNNWGAGVSVAWSRQLFKADSLLVGSLQLLNDSLIVFVILRTGLFYMLLFQIKYLHNRLL